MFKRLFRKIFTVVGAIIGFEAFWIFRTYTQDTFEYMRMSTAEAVILGIFFAIIFGFTFYFIAPLLSRQSNKFANNIGRDLQNVTGSELLAGTLGLIAGLVIAFLLSQIYQGIVPNSIYLTLNITIYVIFGFFGAVIGTKKDRRCCLSLFRECSRGQSPRKKIHMYMLKKTEKGQGYPRYWIPA